MESLKIMSKLFLLFFIPYYKYLYSTLFNFYIYMYIYRKKKEKLKKRREEKRIVEQISREFTLEQFPSSRIYTQPPQGIRGFPVLNHFSTRSITRDKCFARGNSTNNVDTRYRHRRIIESSFFLRSVADFPSLSRRGEG